MVKERDRKSWVEETEMGGEGWGELKHNLRSGCTHRGGWAIGPGSTPPSFVLTPAAFPPVRLVPLALPLSATSVVAHVWGEVAWIVTFSCSMWLPVSVTVSISALISQASVSLAVSSVKWPVLRGAIVIATTESEDRGWWATTPKKKKDMQRWYNKIHVQLSKHTSLSVHNFLPVCVPVLFCLGLCLCHYWMNKWATFCAGVFALCLGLCNGLGSCFDCLCPKTSIVDCEASGGL